MRRLVLIFNFLLLITNFAFAKDAERVYQAEVYPLIGTDEGLFQSNEGVLLPLWTGAGVQKIIFSDRYYLLTDKGLSQAMICILLNSEIPVCRCIQLNIMILSGKK